ncbi:MAG: DsbE family thiol:disulfide interchange protein [Rhodospirillales bacterium]
MSEHARRLLFILPLAALCALGAVFWAGLERGDPHILPSALTGRPVPVFDLPPVKGRSKGLASSDLRGEVALVNVFASWCVACLAEHPFLMQLKRGNIIPVHGLDWREENPDDGPAWLARHGDPYTLIGADPDSRGAVALGVTGAPETFIIGAGGIIHHKHPGPVTEAVWRRDFAPLIEKLRAEQ